MLLDLVSLARLALSPAGTMHMLNLFCCAKTSFTVDHLNDKSQTRDLLNAVFTLIFLSVAIKAKLLVNLLTVAIESDSF